MRAWRAPPNPGARIVVRARGRSSAVPTACFCCLAGVHHDPLRRTRPALLDCTPPLAQPDRQIPRNSPSAAPDRRLAGWDVLYVALILAACAAAFRLSPAAASRSRAPHRLSRSTSRSSCRRWGTSLERARANSAPLFALLLVDGLHRRDRRSILISAAAAAMTLLIPLAVPGSF